MNIILYSNEIEQYLTVDEVIDYKNTAIAQLADSLYQKTNTELEFIKAACLFHPYRNGRGR